MSFDKLSKGERSEWRSLPVSRSAIDLIRARAATSGQAALIEARKGNIHTAAALAGAEEALRVAANFLEHD